MFETVVKRVAIPDFNTVKVDPVASSYHSR